MKRLNYYEVHKNKSTKKLKYSKPYTLKQYAAIEELNNVFYEQVLRLRKEFNMN